MGRRFRSRRDLEVYQMGFEAVAMPHRAPPSTKIMYGAGVRQVANLSYWLFSEQR